MKTIFYYVYIHLHTLRALSSRSLQSSSSRLFPPRFDEGTGTVAVNSALSTGPALNGLTIFLLLLLCSVFNRILRKGALVNGASYIFNSNQIGSTTFFVRIYVFKYLFNYFYLLIYFNYLCCYWFRF